MKFEYQEKEYRIKFQYAKHQPLKHVVCMVYNAFPIYGDNILSSAATCHELDTFVKDKGRRIALKRAISNQPEDFRMAVWDCYLSHTFKGHIRNKRKKLTT